MKLKRIIIIVMGLAVLLLAVVALLPDSQPSYQGRTLTAWVEEMCKNPPGTPPWLTASNAIHSIGTNAVPTVLRWETYKESKTRESFISKWNAHAYYEWRIRTQEERKTMVWFAFGALGENSSPAWPVFVQWTRDTNTDSRRRGITLLRGCRADKSVFVPIAEQLLKDPDSEIQVLTALYFRDLYPQEAETSGVYQKFPNLKPTPAVTANTNQPTAK